MAIVKTYNSFLSEDLYANSLNSARQVFSTGENVFYTNRCWGYGIVKDSFPVLIHRIYEESSLFQELKNKIEEATSLRIHNSIMFYFWTRFSYIPWHIDQEYDGAMTIYLNETWDEDFGGYFLYKEKNQIKGIVPEKNLAVFQANGLSHCTTPVNYDGDTRITIQAFLRKREGENK